MNISAAAPRIPFLAFVADEATEAVLRAHAQKQGYPADSVRKGDVAAAASYLRTGASPAILVVDVTDAKTAPAAFDALADVCEPGTSVIATGTINEYSFYCWLVGIGIPQYLLKPLTEEALVQAVQHTSAPPATVASSAKETAKPGRTIAVIGTRGGVGATTLSVNLASVIAEELKQKTVLLDLDPQQGTVAMALDLEPGRGLRDALEKPERIDSLFLERVMVRYSDHLSVLSTEESLDDPIHHHPEAAAFLLGELQGKAETVLIDLPRGLYSLTRQALKLADQIVLVTELTLPGLRDALRFGDFLRDIVKAKPPLIVANRTGLAAKHEMSRAEFEKGMGGKLTAAIPFEVEVFASGTAGELLIDKHKNSQTLRQIRALAALLLPDVAVGKPNHSGLQKRFLSFGKGK